LLRVRTALGDTVQPLDPLICDTLAVLGRSAPLGADLGELRNAFQSAQTKLGSEQILGEPTACLAALQDLAQALTIDPPTLTMAQRELMGWQLIGGGPPEPFALSSRLVDGTHRLADTVGLERASSPAEMDWVKNTIDGTLIDLAPEGVAALSAEIEGRLDSGDRELRRSALRALAHLGPREGCESIAGASLFPAIGRVSTDGEADIASKALALRTLKECGVGDVTGRAAAEVVRAQEVLEGLDGVSVSDAYAAQFALCALQPDRMLEAQAFWDAYSTSASEYGGLLADDTVSLESTLDLASLLVTDSGDCREGNVLW